MTNPTVCWIFGGSNFSRSENAMWLANGFQVKVDKVFLKDDVSAVPTANDVAQPMKTDLQCKITFLSNF